MKEEPETKIDWEAVVAPRRQLIASWSYEAKWIVGPKTKGQIIDWLTKWKEQEET
tara:strand:+ start:1125 stop:1289 length:165 start_codon:yes stop_codon:yes gene_type:complete